MNTLAITFLHHAQTLDLHCSDALHALSAVQLLHQTVRLRPLAYDGCVSDQTPERDLSWSETLSRVLTLFGVEDRWSTCWTPTA